MSEKLLDIKNDDEKFFNLLDEYRKAKGLEINEDFTKGECNVVDLINVITRLECEILMYNYIIENGKEDVSDYILSDVCGGIMDPSSPSFRKYLLDD